MNTGTKLGNLAQSQMSGFKSVADSGNNLPVPDPTLQISIGSDLIKNTAPVSSHNQLKKIKKIYTFEFGR